MTIYIVEYKKSFGAGENAQVKDSMIKEKLNGLKDPKSDPII